MGDATGGSASSDEDAFELHGEALLGAATLAGSSPGAANANERSNPLFVPGEVEQAGSQQAGVLGDTATSVASEGPGKKRGGVLWLAKQFEQRG